MSSSLQLYYLQTRLYVLLWRWCIVRCLSWPSPAKAGLQVYQSGSQCNCNNSSSLTCAIVPRSSTVGVWIHRHFTRSVKSRSQSSCENGQLSSLHKSLDLVIMLHCLSRIVIVMFYVILYGVRGHFNDANSSFCFTCE